MKVCNSVSMDSEWWWGIHTLEKREMVASAAIPGHANTSTPVEYLQ